MFKRNSTQSYLLVFSIILLLSGCKENDKPQYGVSLTALLEITPGQSTQEEVLGLIGEPDSVDDEGLMSVYWDYYSENDPKILLRVHFLKDTSLVELAFLEGDNFKVQDLVTQFGEPAVVYQADVSEHCGDDYYRVFFSYPEQGLEAYVDNPNPKEDELLDMIIRKHQSETAELIAEIQDSCKERLIDWP